MHLHDDALEFLAEVSDGDARRALSAPGGRRAVEPTSGRSSSRAQLAEESVQRKAVEYDRARATRITTRPAR